MRVLASGRPGPILSRRRRSHERALSWATVVLLSLLAPSRAYSSSVASVGAPGTKLTVRVTINQQYEDAPGLEIKAIRRLCEAVARAAGLTIADRHHEDPDMWLQVKLQAKPLTHSGTSPVPDRLYGAEVCGEVVLRAGAKAVRKPFAGLVDLDDADAILVKSPKWAPFIKAIDRSGFAPLVCELVSEAADVPLVDLLVAALLAKTDSRMRASLVRPLVEVGKPALQPLLSALSDERSAVRRAAADVLGQVGGPAIGPLLKALKSSDPKVRAAAVRALGVAECKEAVEPLLAMVEDEDSDVRLAVLLALGRIGDTRALPALIDALNAEWPVARAVSVRSLGSMGPAGLEPLISALNDVDLIVRHAAVKQLAKSEDPRAFKALVAKLEGPDRKLHRRIIRTFGERRNPRAIPAIMAAVARESRLIHDGRRALRQIGEAGVPQVIEALAMPEDDVKVLAARALAEFQDPRAIGPLVTALGTVGPLARADICEALESFGKASVPPLVAALGDSSPRMREGAAYALGRIKDDRAVAPLQDVATNDPDWKVRTYARHALKAIRDQPDP